VHEDRIVPAKADEEAFMGLMIGSPIVEEWASAKGFIGWKH
jgi:hypothetical protein